jgi:16S rRNA (guanine527-N7)-methyltransferase
VKHLDVDRQSVDKVLRWVGVTLDSHQWGQLQALAEWLRDEAVGAGGIGPNESARIWSRHIADSLAFSCGWRAATPPPRLLDVGSGVGLPGIPLAVLWPQVAVTLLDRAEKRADLVKRAVRQLDLENVEVRQGDVRSERTRWDGAVFRAVLPPLQALEVARTVLRPGGTAVIGLRGAHSASSFPDQAEGEWLVQRIEVPRTVLDGPVSLLRMGSSEH